MTKTAIRILVVTVGILAWTGISHGAGYGIYEQGARALGMAGAFTAQAADPSAIFFNPAGLTQLEGTQVSVGVSPILISRSFKGAAPYPGAGVSESSPTTLGTPITFYASHRISPELAAGFGVYNPFGLITKWENKDTFTGRFISRESGLTPFYLTPVLAFRPVPRFSLAAGPTLVLSSVHLERNVAAANPYYGHPSFPGAIKTLDLGTLEIDGNGSKVGWTAGARFELSDQATLGAVYRSKADVEYDDADADFAYQFDGSGNSSLDALLGPALSAKFPADQKVSVKLPLPASAVLGFAFKPAEDWTVEIDGLWTQWSCLETVGLTFADSASLSTLITENWDDAFSVRAGAEWRKTETLALRAGAYWDQTPQPVNAMDPLLPDADRFGVTLGAGLGLGRVHADLFGLLLIIQDRSTDGQSLRQYEGTYDTGVTAFGLNLNYKF